MRSRMSLGPKATQAIGRPLAYRSQSVKIPVRSPTSAPKAVKPAREATAANHRAAAVGESCPANASSRGLVLNGGSESVIFPRPSSAESREPTVAPKPRVENLTGAVPPCGTGHANERGQRGPGSGIEIAASRTLWASLALGVGFRTHHAPS